MSNQVDNHKPLNNRNYYIYDQYGDNDMEPVGPVGLLPLPSMRNFAQSVNEHLYRRRRDYDIRNPSLARTKPGFLREDYCLNADCIRFGNGEGKVILSDTVRGHDLFILVDVLNYACTYKLFGHDKLMSPDEHYQDLKRLILAISGKARRINVIMPFLYEGRQHKRSNRESLDCAFMLQELAGLGVANVITFDAHDPRVSNAIPLNSFESLPTSYQLIKCLRKTIPELGPVNNRLMIISPDEGGISRAMYLASMLGAPLGMFYKRRDYTRVVNGRNPILNHEFLGDNVEDMDVLVIDDMISSGDSMLDIAYELKKRKARKIYCAATFGLFASGLASFDKAYSDGVIDKIFCTNLIYRSPELLSRAWFEEVNLAKFVALLIDAINHDASLSRLIDPTIKIRKLLNQRV